MKSKIIGYLHGIPVHNDDSNIIDIIKNLSFYALPKSKFTDWICIYCNTINKTDKCIECGASHKLECENL